MPNNDDAMRERAKKYLRGNGIVWHVESRTPDIVADFAARESADLEAKLERADTRWDELLNCYRRNIVMHESGPWAGLTDEQKAAKENYIAGLKRGLEIIQHVSGEGK